MRSSTARAGTMRHGGIPERGFHVEEWRVPFTERDLAEMTPPKKKLVQTICDGSSKLAWQYSTAAENSRIRNRMCVQSCLWGSEASRLSVVKVHGRKSLKVGRLTVGES